MVPALLFGFSLIGVRHFGFFGWQVKRHYYMARYGEVIMKLLEFPSRYPESMLSLATPTLFLMSDLEFFCRISPSSNGRILST